MTLRRAIIHSLKVWPRNSAVIPYNRVGEAADSKFARCSALGTASSCGWPCQLILGDRCFGSVNPRCHPTKDDLVRCMLSQGSRGRARGGRQSSLLNPKVRSAGGRLAQGKQEWESETPWARLWGRRAADRTLNHNQSSRLRRPTASIPCCGGSDTHSATPSCFIPRAAWVTCRVIFTTERPGRAQSRA
jgi:hypothetical protein